jgi:hypothetical protein
MVFSRSSSQDVKARAKAGAAVAQSRAYQAKAAAVRAQELARQAATTQVAPLARNAQEKAGRGLHEARAWTAPRVEAGGVAVQERLAPAVSAALVTAARRIEPVKARHRRWPVIVVGVVVLGAGCAAAAQVLRSRRNAASMAASDPATPPPVPPATPGERQEMTDAPHADVNGQVRTP